MLSYAKFEEIKKHFIPLTRINEPIDITKLEDSEFFMINCLSGDDVHKAMKYGFWSSTDEINKDLGESFARTHAKGWKTILFFRVAFEETMVGAAELVSEFQPEVKFDLWWNKMKGKGVFNIKWLFVQNVDLSSFEQLEKGKPLYEIANGTQLSLLNGISLLDFFSKLNFSIRTSIFFNFSHYDQLEDLLMETRSSTDFQIKLLKKQRHKMSYHEGQPSKCHDEKSMSTDNKEK